MKKSSVISMMAILLSLGFCVLYFGIFAHISENSPAPEDTVEASAEPDEIFESSVMNEPESRTLTWIQAGVFARDSSVRELTSFLQQDGFEPVSYPRGEYQIVAVGLSLDETETQQVKQKMIDLDYEWMERSCELTEQQLRQFYEGQTALVLEGCTSQP